MLPDRSAEFRSVGVVNFEGALTTSHLQIAEEYYNWRLEHQGGGAPDVIGERDATFQIMNALSIEYSPTRRLLRDTPIVEIAASAFGGGPVWLVEDQIFYKEGKETGAQRTAWHQDAPYIPWDGMKSIVVWFSLDPVPRDCTLEFVRGTHTGPIYAIPNLKSIGRGSKLDESDPLSRIPSIEAERADWPIVSWAHEPGDVLAFHTAIIHGGGATRPHSRRRSLSIRFVGDDAKRVPRSVSANQPHMQKIYELDVDQPVYAAEPPKVWPRCAGAN